MLKTYSKITLLFSVVLYATACKTYYPISYQSSLEKVTQSVQSDTSIKAYYLPFKDSLDKIMKIPIAELKEDIVKKMPESTLGNLMADILKIKTQAYLNTPIDFSVLNYGGIRMGSLTKGTLNIEHAYLLMPFDNYLVAQNLTGQQVQFFCDSIATVGGWPVSGISLQIKDKKAIQILINDVPLEASKTYNMATNDYLANGGDGMTILKSIPQIQTGKLYRDAIIEYFKEQTKAGKFISSSLENRITYAK